MTQRKDLGYSQEELSRLSGISLRTIQRIEKEQVNPRGYTLRALCETLELDISDFKENPPIEKSEQAKHVKILNAIGLLVLIFPLISTLIQVVYWVRQRHILHNNDLSKKIISFQVYWIITVLISMLLIHVVTFSLTGQSTYGHFPIRIVTYCVLLIANVGFILFTSARLPENSPTLLVKVPSLF